MKQPFRTSRADPLTSAAYRGQRPSATSWRSTVDPQPPLDRQHSSSEPAGQLPATRLALCACRRVPNRVGRGKRPHAGDWKLGREARPSSDGLSRWDGNAGQLPAGMDSPKQGSESIRAAADPPQWHWADHSSSCVAPTTSISFRTDLMAGSSRAMRSISRLVAASLATPFKTTVSPSVRMSIP